MDQPQQVRLVLREPRRLDLEPLDLPQEGPLDLEPLDLLLLDLLPLGRLPQERLALRNRSPMAIR
jgi:hypothetical protein